MHRSSQAGESGRVLARRYDVLEQRGPQEREEKKKKKKKTKRRKKTDVIA